MDIKARILQFTFRAAAGRFFTRVGKDQFENIRFSGSSIAFTGHDLELNAATINAEAFKNSDIRLVSGFINTVEGDFPLNTQQTRRVEVEGVTLLFDCVGGLAAPPPAQPSPPPQPSSSGLRTSSKDLGALGRIVSVEELYSSMVEESAQVKSNSNNAASASVAPEQLPANVDECAEALNATVKALLLNTVGILHNVTVRMRVPAPGQRIVPGQALPPDTIELFVHIPRIDVTDASDATAINSSSFRKRIYFSGFVVQAYDAVQHDVEEGDSQFVHHMNLADTVLQGEPINIDPSSDGKAKSTSSAARNELDIELNEQIQGQPTWSKRLSMTQVHAVLTPSQLVRVLRVMEYFNRVPTGNSSQDDSNASAVPETSSRLRILLSDVSLALLHDENAAAVERLWYRYNTMRQDLGVELDALPHYSVRLTQFLVQQVNPMSDIPDATDKYQNLFGKIRGASVTVKLMGAIVKERRPSSSSSIVILRLEPPKIGDTTTCLIANMRQSYTMSIEQAKQFGLENVDQVVDTYAREHGHDPYDFVRSPNVRIALQHVLVHERLGVQLSVDVEILDRILAFVKSLSDISAKAKRASPIGDPVSTATVPLDPMTLQSTSNGAIFYSARSQSNSERGSDEMLDALGDMKPVEDDGADSELDLCSSPNSPVSKPQFPAAAPPSISALGKTTTTPQGQPAVGPSSLQTQRPKTNSPSTIPPIVIVMRVISAHFRGFSVELKFPVHRPPRPDLYGPDTIRLFEALCDSAANAAAFDGESTCTSGDHFLPRTLICRCDLVNVSMPTGSVENTDVKMEGIVCTMRDVTSGDHVTLLAATEAPHPDANVPKNKSVKMAQTTASVAVSAMPTIKLTKRPLLVVPPLDLEQVEEGLKSDDGPRCRAKMTRDAAIAVDIRIPYLTSEALYRDNYLLLLFMVNELSECVNGALDRDARRWQEGTDAQQPVQATEPVVPLPNSTPYGKAPLVVVNLAIDRACVEMRASRLAASGAALGETLWTLLSAQDRQATSSSLHYHRYSVDARDIAVFVALQSPSPTESLLCAAVTARAFSLSEEMPRELPAFPAPVTTSWSVPRWAHSTRLLESYTGMFERAHELSRAQIDAVPHVLQVFARRRFNTRLKTDHLDTTVVLDRILVTHQPAHDGDHWLFALMALFSDVPVIPPESDQPRNVSMAAPSQDGDDAASTRVSFAAVPTAAVHAVDNITADTPYSANFSVVVAIRDVLMEYQPFGRTEKLVLTIPSVDFTTGDLVSGHLRSEMKAYIDEPICVMMHDNFRPPVHQCFSHENRRLYLGAIGKGVRGGLAELGFVDVATLAHQSSSAPKKKEAESAHVSKRFVPGASQARLFESTADLRVSMSMMASARALPKPRTPAVRILTACYDDKPFVVDISGLDFEVSAAYDSFQRFQAILQHFLSGGDVAYLPSPYHFVAHSGPKFGSLQKPPIPQPPPRVAPDHQGAPIVTTGEVDASAVDGTRQPSDDVVNTFDVIEVDDEGAEVQRAPQAVAWVPPDYYVQPRAPQALPSRLGGFTGSIDDFNDPEPPPEWPAGFLTGLFSQMKYFSRANTKFRKRFGYDVPSIEIPDAPPIALELLIHDSVLRLALSGGGDFEWSKETVETYSDFDLMQPQTFKYYTRTDGRRFMRSARHEDEQIVVELKGFFLQVDAFEAGHSMQTLIHMTSTDAVVLDRVVTSPIRQLLWCETPPPQRDRPVLEFRWITYASTSPNAPGVTFYEEEMALRALPLHVSLSRVTSDILVRFMPQGDAAARAAVSTVPAGAVATTASGASTPSPAMYFRRFKLHGLSLRFSWYPDVREVAPLIRGNYLELKNFLTVEGSAVDLAGIEIRNCSSDDLVTELTNAIIPQLYSTNIIFLLAGLQPIRTATEVAGAVGDLVLTPLEYLQNNKSVYNGIARGLAQCSRRLAGESLRVASHATRFAHEGVHWMASPVAPHVHADPLYRGDQPEGIRDGVVRGAKSVAAGVASMGAALRFGVMDGASDAASLVKLPLSLLLPVDGALRGLTEVLLGTRNELQPERRRDDVQEFKSNKFSGAPKQP